MQKYNNFSAAELIDEFIDEQLENILASHEEKKETRSRKRKMGFHKKDRLGRIISAKPKNSPKAKKEGELKVHRNHSNAKRDIGIAEAMKEFALGY